MCISVIAVLKYLQQCIAQRLPRKTVQFPVANISTVDK